MIKKIQTVELQASTNLVLRSSDTVTLTVNLSDLELERITAEHGPPVFAIDGVDIELDAHNPRMARWTPQKMSTAVYHATVAVAARNEKPHVIGETWIHTVATRAEGGPEWHLEVNDGERGVEEGELIDLEVAGPPVERAKLHWRFDAGNKGTIRRDNTSATKAFWDTSGMLAGTHTVSAWLVDERGSAVTSGLNPVVLTGTGRVRAQPLGRGDTLRVSLQRPAALRTRDQAFWSLIRSCTGQISGARYAEFIEGVLCKQKTDLLGRGSMLASRLVRDARDLQPFSYGVGAYELLKTATQVFLLLECGGCHAEIKNLDPDDESLRFGEQVTLEDLRARLCAYIPHGQLPYIKRVLDSAFQGETEIASLHCYGVLSSRIQVPCLLELIWSYWHEEGMLVQSIGAIARRFQNVRARGDRDPLAHLEIDPLRPLGNLLWGYIQDEPNLLSVKRRAYEYDHQYGLQLYGKAVPPLRSADSRSKFLEAFHHLLHRCSIFYKEDNDTTVIADGFALLNALQEVHILLAEGANNQFGDLPWTARAEMLMQQWLLSRPEMRDFLQGRRMVPYKEPWMATVDTMKALQGWTDIPVTYFRDLGVYGEQILLTIRYGDWIDVNNEEAAKNWARSWRPEVQGYLHAYRAVTGMDLTNAEMVDHTMPAIHLQNRLAMQRSR
ncbi:hypothetical protein ACSHT2_21855 [Bradyrhizobium sp. PUT101]|uniref:hypothetical protein n=1 Tax=Bradyrhizobium sp. PUT101 TaxID=3447427 RepID=UPI003F85AD0D